MSDEPENLMRVDLRRLATGQDTIRDDVREIKLRLTALEIAVGNLAATELSHYALTADRVDRMSSRIERIETRLDLKESG